VLNKSLKTKHFILNFTFPFSCIAYQINCLSENEGIASFFLYKEKERKDEVNNQENEVSR